MDEFTPAYRMNENANGTGIALYVRSVIPSRLILLKNYDKDIEYFLVEINLRRK